MKQQAKKLEHALVAVEKALTALHCVGGGLLNHPGVDQIHSDLTKIAEKIAELQKRIVMPAASGNSSKYNRRTMLGDYFRELTWLWKYCGDGRLHENALRQFLLACSRAPFAEISTEDLDDKVDSFLSNLPHSRKR